MGMTTTNTTNIQKSKTITGNSTIIGNSTVGVNTTGIISSLPIPTIGVQDTIESINILRVGNCELSIVESVYIARQKIVDKYIEKVFEHKNMTYEDFQKYMSIYIPMGWAEIDLYNAVFRQLKKTPNSNIKKLINKYIKNNKIFLTDFTDQYMGKLIIFDFIDFVGLDNFVDFVGPIPEHNNIPNFFEILPLILFIYPYSEKFEKFIIESNNPMLLSTLRDKMPSAISNALDNYEALKILLELK